MTPLTSRQWDRLSLWAFLAGCWCIVFGTMRLVAADWPVFWASLAGGWISLFVFWYACKRSSLVKQSLFAYGNEKVLSVCARDLYAHTWTVEPPGDWQDLQAQLIEDFGNESLFNTELGYRTSYRQFVTPEQADYVVRAYGKLTPPRVSGHALQPAELGWTGFST